MTVSRAIFSRTDPRFGFSKAVSSNFSYFAGVDFFFIDELLSNGPGHLHKAFQKVKSPPNPLIAPAPRPSKSLNEKGGKPFQSTTAPSSSSRFFFNKYKQSPPSPPVILDASASTKLAFQIPQSLPLPSPPNPLTKKGKNLFLPWFDGHLLPILISSSTPVFVPDLLHHESQGSRPQICPLFSGRL
ncbi:hypothetical protein MRB53_016655 [Persea americana]|uniref:Uncharacterized protein n=1 Tax=Persea americana TaxID=3435 RepID=A0ACC2M2W5_PERAE|nr:hypothetical protein MRB53_016655 [Persea americana]